MFQVKAGDLNKMGLLFERYHRKLFSFLYYMTGKDDASEDLVQNVFFRMLKYRHTFTGEGEFKTWMYHLARNVLADHSQKNKRSVLHEDVQNYSERISSGAGADDSIYKEQELTTLYDSLGKLPEEYREILVLSRFQELKYEEIARILNTTEGAVKVKVHRAMNQLKNIYLKLEQ
ncbi:RNA polymerase sigma factor [Xanthocytophaga flava]|uniref:RNA polymerase sigma factor n=1 Tax=Xanthocytophaga flava TaxID=3048013 RepID=UPI0028D11C3D|nr:RNA polymerase sigma factor [Xanthocytophaga flavus]MDJ1467981.1 RNA polymerase sigma factor [Xanthocytophaga flavus]